VLGDRTWDEWIRQYATSHQNPVNRACHMVGIPMIAISVLMAPLLPWRPSWWALPASLFGFGWFLQFVGHAVERKPPEFFRDWRFLLVGVRWWIAKVTGRA
jgi:uncharacterized membrane protein YGL010W